MKIKLGPAGIPLGCKGGILEAIKYVKKIGLQAIEVEFVRGVKMSNELAEKVGKIAKENEVAISVHAPYFINLCNPEKIKDSIKRILDSCERAQRMHANVVVFHPGYYGKYSKEECYEIVLDACDEMSKKCNDVLLGLETTGKHSQFGTLEEIMKICNKVNSCVPVIDFAHIYARNNGKIDYENIFSVVKKFKYLHTHFSGIEFSKKGERKHLPIKKSKPNPKELARAILSQKWVEEIVMISESPLLEKDAILMKNYFEELNYKFE
ncbi:MAG: TIM barrel protein [Candidatus Aenigmarchaeota archaeon]|nr:TIM barrel protein [Candidatus Aenigmarchaeota archaeon]